MVKQKTIGWIAVFFIAWTGFAGAAITAPFAGTWVVDILEGFSTEPQPPPIDEYTASKWRILTKAAIAGTDLTVDNCYILVNGVEVGSPGLSAGYVESDHAVRQGDQIQLHVVEASYYTKVMSFVVPQLGPLKGGQTYYVLNTCSMYGQAHADATLSASYAGTDIDAANWDISVSTEYTAVTITLNVETANFNNLAMGPEKYTEIVGDKDTYSKFIKFDCNDSAVIIKDVKLEGISLQMRWTTFSAGSDYQAVYEFDQMLINDARVSGDGIYDLTFTFEAANANNTIAVTYHVGRADSTSGVDVESAAVGSVGTADETVTITTE